MFKELNREVIDWGVDTSKMEFRKCSDICGQQIAVKGLFITPDNGFGKGAVLITKDYLLNIPQRYVELVESILATGEMVEAVKAGHLAVKITDFDSKKYKRKGYDVEFLDV